jgi:uncharacterized protein YecT (DUF1311 family)
MKTYAFALAVIAAMIPVQPEAAPIGDDAYDKCMNSSEGTNTAWAGCGGAWIEREEGRLAISWERVRNGLTGTSRTSLETEQRAWLAYKNASCEMFKSGYFGREGQVLHFPVCRAGLIAARVRELDVLWSFLNQGTGR